MIAGIGTDSLRIERMERSMEREAFLKRVFTQQERDYINSRTLAAQSAAGMFCVKEAVLKALHKGITDMPLTNIEVFHEESGAPYAVLHDEIGKQFNLHISITHTEDTASAFVVLEKEDTR